MKNILVANLIEKRKDGRRNDRAKARVAKDLLRLVKAQVDNSLMLGWKSEDIWLATNFIEDPYKGIKILNVPLPDCQVTASKTFAIKEILNLDLTDAVLWIHDLDCWQNVWFDEPEFAHIGITGYNPNKFNGGSVFYRPTDVTKKLVNRMVDILIEARENPKDKGREEPVLNNVLVASKNPEAQGVVTMLDQSYNLGCSSFVERYLRSDKPIKVCHFTPLNRLAWDTFVRDRNRINVRVINDRLIGLFITYFGDQIEKYTYHGERGYDGDWKPVDYTRGGFSGLETRGREEIQHIIYEDRYRFRKLLTNQHIDFVIDIGANLGVFALFARFLHPESTIIAIEPVDETLRHLNQNVKGFNIYVEPVALGDGRLFYFHEMKDNISHIVDSEPPEGAKKKDLKYIPSKSLPEIFAKYNIPLDSQYVLKFDCEGGESYFLEDKETINIFRNAKQIMGEIHFYSKRTPYWRPWGDYNDWIQDNFSGTHSIEYYNSSKHRGKGHYLLCKK